MSSVLNLDVEICISKTNLIFSSKIFLYAQNDPIIESSNHLEFAPYNVAYPHLLEHMHEAGLPTDHNRWDVIFDFTTNEHDGVKVSNFTTLPED